MGFADSIKLAASKMQSQVNAKIDEVATDLFTTIVNKSPILTGNLSNNWYVGLGSGNYNYSYSMSTNKDGVQSRNQISLLRNVTEFLGKDGEVSFTNSTPYGRNAEYLGWPTPQWSGRVGPYAMVRNSLLEVATKYKGVNQA
jgi:hypothetical protein